MKPKVRAIIGTIIAASLMCLSSVNFNINEDAIVHPQFFNAVAFVLGVGFLMIALDGIIKWNEENEEGDIW